MRIYKCSAKAASGLNPEALELSGIVFPDAYEKRLEMVSLSQAVRRAEGTPICILPFCRTLEAEALGGNIKRGTDKACPRVGEAAYESIREIEENLCEIDFSLGRIRETLEAVRLLKDQGETVALELTGPITVLSSLTDARHVFKALRRDRETMARVMKHLSSQTLRFIEEGKAAGADYFIYSDSAGAPDIIGPKLTKQLAEDYLCDFLRDAGSKMDKTCIMILCSKYYHALSSLGLAEERIHTIEAGMRFSDALISLKGEIAIAGQLCLKHTDARIMNGTIRELIL